MVSIHSISIVVTTYNCAKHVDKIKQLLSNVSNVVDEIIIVDDCSVDNTIQEIRKMDLAKIKILQTEKNSGRPSIPRNLGINQTNSEWVILCDADDIIPTEYIEFLKLQVPSQIYTGTKVRFENISSIKQNMNINFSKRIKVTKRALRCKNLITLSGTAIPTSIAKQFQFQNTPLEDWLYWKELSRENINIIKLIDCPIFYWSGLSLSPNKFRQISRVYKYIGAHRFIFYIFYYLKLRLWERLLEQRYLKYN